jgi:exodeoxyribonuclease-3
MIITAWNCNMRFHEKHASAAVLDSDIMVISECAQPEVLIRKGLQILDGSCIWVGKDVNKGLAVFARPPYKISRLFDDLEDLPMWCMPVRITTPSKNTIDLLAVWSFWVTGTKNVKIPNQVAAALSRFSGRMSMSDVIVAGDFNNNVIWRSRDVTRNHDYTNDLLSSFGLSSAYHVLSGDEHGSEQVPTIFWQKRTVDGPRYHLDYIYLPKKWLAPPTSISIGEHAQWVANRLSDHVPLTVTLPLIR